MMPFWGAGERQKVGTRRTLGAGPLGTVSALFLSCSVSLLPPVCQGVKNLFSHMFPPPWYSDPSFDHRLKPSQIRCLRQVPSKKQVTHVMSSTSGKLLFKGIKRIQLTAVPIAEDNIHTTHGAYVEPSPRCSSLFGEGRLSAGSRKRNVDTSPTTKPLTYNLSACKIYWSSGGRELVGIGGQHLI